MTTATGAPVQPTCRRGTRHLGLQKRLLPSAVLVVCLALLVRTFFLDSYQVPTGSMAPHYLGHHRACDCPRCGFPVEVGLHPRDSGESETDPYCYRLAWCPNCGATGLPLHRSPVVPGHRLMVNRTATAPRRWQIVLLHLFGLDLVKRILGLPGETVEIKDGDLYIDGVLCRKTLDEFKAMRILVFDNNYQPRPMTWAARWETAPYRPGFHPLSGTSLHLEAAAGDWHVLAYRHFCLDTHKFFPLMDEYAYNGADPRKLVPVHDVMLECDLEILEGQGTLALGITDGGTHLLARLPVGRDGLATVEEVPVFSLPVLKEKAPPVATVSGV